MNSEQWKLDQLRRRDAVRERRAAVGGDSRPGPMRGDGPLVSVVVVCWNAAAVLDRCLRCLLAQDYPSYEIIVVDDGSDDATVQIAEQAARRGELTLVRSRRNRGCPSARNLGLREATGEIVAFIDADGFATAQWLGAVVEAFGEDPSIGGIASTVFFDDNPLVVNGAGGTVNRQGWAADLSMNESYEVARIASEALYPMGCGMALRREAIERVGPFDERMLNYYDDVDYGTRVWRAGYRVRVAPEAWIDHGSGAPGGESARKRLLCERHRMRVVLKHARTRELPRWALAELRSLRVAPWTVRAQKLRSIAWNLRWLANLLAGRRRLRSAPPAPQALIDRSWGDGFPAGLTERSDPAPSRAGASVSVDDGGAGQLLHGWFAAESRDGRRFRWASTHAALLVHLERPAALMRIDYSHAPVDVGRIDVAIRRVGSADPLSVVRQACLLWRYVARSVESHPVALPAGDYEVTFSAKRGWSDPPRETRALAFAFSRLSFIEALEIPVGGIDMSSPGVERQLVSGWFEAEHTGDFGYRWAGARAQVLVRLASPVVSACVCFRLPPASQGTLELEFSPLDANGTLALARLIADVLQWREERVAVELAPGDYLVTLRSGSTWSNPQQADANLWAENRALGFALSSLIFLARSGATAT